MSSWEEYTKTRKKKQSSVVRKEEQTSYTPSSSWENYVETRTSNKNNDIAPVKTTVTTPKATVTPKQEEKSGWKKTLDTILGVGGNLLMGAESAFSNTVDYIDTLQETVAKKASGAVFNFILDKSSIDEDKKEAISKIGKPIIEDVVGKKVYSTANKASGTGLQQLNDALNSEEMDQWRTKTIQGNIDKSAGKVGKYAAELAPSIGQNVTNMGLTVLNPTLGTTMFMTSAGGSYLDEAEQRGMDEGSALVYATVMGGVEGLTERLISGQMIKAGASIVGAKAITKETIGKIAGSYGFSIAENAIQEAVTEPISEFTAQTVAGKEYANWDDIGQRMLKAGFDGAVSGIILSGVSAGVGSSVRVYNKMQNGQEVTQTEITEAINDTREAGIDVDQIATDNLVEASNIALQEVTSAKQSNEGQVQGLQEEIEAKETELQQAQDLREQQIIQEEIEVLQEELNEATNAQQITDENQLRRQNFTYQAQETDSDIKKAIYESASQVMNNTEKSHKFVDVVAKIAEEKGTTYKFTNNEQLKQLGYTKDNVTVNGLVNENGEVLINVDSAKALNTVVGHETTHLLEGTKEYETLKQVALDYAKSKGDYDTKMAQLHNLYKDTDANIENELVSDIVGDYLFTDENFVKELSVKQPTLFEKIKNFISDLVVKFKGTDQEKQLRQLQRSFEKAYKAQGTQTTDTKYSVSENNEINTYSTGIHDEQVDMIKEIEDKNKVIAKLEYSIYNNKPRVQMIEVQPEYRRKGLAKKLLQDLQNDYKNTPIDFGMTTPDGTKLLNEIIYEVENKEYVNIQKQLEKVTDRINEIETNNVWNDDIDTEYYKLLDKQRKLDKKLFDLEVDGNNKTDRFVKLDNPDIRYSLSEDTQGRKLKPNVQKWTENSKVRDENGNLKVLYHGTATGKFTVFDKSKASVEGDWGTGFYFTDSEYDVDTNYEDGGPDFNNKIVRLAEQIEQEEDISYEEAKEKAEEQLYKGGHKFEVYLNIENPAIVGKTYLFSPENYSDNYNQEDFDSEEEYYEAIDQLVTDDIDSAIWAIEREYDFYNGTDDIRNLLYEAYYEGGMEIQNLKDRLGGLYLETDEGLVGHDVARIIIESLGYDGIIDPTVSTKWNMDMDSDTTHYIAFKPNQIKSITNENPTDNPDINMSLSARNQKETPTGQWNVRGEDVKLQVEEAIAPVQEVVTQAQETIKQLQEQVKVMQESLAPIQEKTYYHGTRGNFDTFDNSKIGQNYEGEWSSLGKGFYFTNDYNSAKEFGEASINEGEVTVKEAKLDIKNPFYVEDLTNNDKQTIENIKAKYELEDISNGYNLIDALQKKGLDSTEVLKEYGYDGIIAEDEVMVFDASQINSTTKSEQIQENIAPVQKMQPTQPTLEEVQNLMNIKENKSGSEYASAFYALRDKYGQTELYKSLNEYYAKGTVTQPSIDLTPTSQDIVEQQGQEAFNNITDNEAPIDVKNMSFEDAVDELMWNEEYETTSPEQTPSPFDNRDIDEVGKRNVKAYQYENPEVRPYFQEEAQNMMWDLDNTIKGEKSFNDQLYYDSNGEQGWYGTTRQTTEAIAYLKDNYGYSYEQIRKGLNDIIEDNGKENNAVAKRIEFMLDERLREGYTTSDGIPIPANENYINFLNERNITEYNREISSTLTDTDAPIENETEIAPIEETKIMPTANEILNDLDTKVDETIKNYSTAQNNVAPEVQESTTGQLELKVEEDITPTKKVTQKRDTELSDTSIETQEQEKIAQILSEAPTQQNKKQRLWAKVKAGIFDKGSVFEDLSIKNKNRELMSKWDYTLTSEARAQNVMMNGTYEFNPSSKERTQVSKSLNDIRTEVGENVQEFSEYLYHKHNISRMSLESNAQVKMEELKSTTLQEYDNEAIEKLSRKRITDKTDEETVELINTAKEYVRLKDVKNKPVFGNSVTAEVSQQKVNEFEMNNPEFMDWANDVYNYNKANLNELIKSGVISQETADNFAEMYPHYVPIGRAKNLGNAINVPLDTNRTGINAPIARATGGNSDILPLFDTMAKRTLQTYRATAKNNFGVELKNTLKGKTNNQTTNIDEILDSVDQQETLLQEGKNGQAPTFTVFENGEKVTYEITEDIYNALKHVSDSSILSTTFKPFNKISNFHRGVLTEYNPVFMLTNSIKDFQDVLLNSQHAAKTYSKFGESYAQILNKGYWYQEYMANGGEQNSYFDSQEGTFETERKGISKVLDLPPLKQISQLNNIIEMAPRLAEYIASRETGRSIETSMLDAARVTTNFKAGGDITKWANRNGATFLNASIQGAMQQVRNVREAHANGLKGYANLASKFALAGVPAMILNSLLWGDDEEYEELSDYVKQSYYIVGKYGDGNFIRIPKGRMITVVQEGLNQMKNLVTGDDEVDLGQFLEIVGNNIAPNNPVESNVLSPIIQAASNTTWYGDDLVPTRLQDVPAKEQFDESIDKLSIAIGQATGISPYKINYVLDQYSGGIGDVFLPMMTEQAEGGNDSLGSKLIAPLTSKFSVDSTMKNQNVSDLYTLSEKITTKANSSKATDTDILQNKYLNSVKAEMNELYKEKREIQSDTTLSDSQKYNKVRNIQKQINDMAQKGIEEYENVEQTFNYASIGDKEYYNKNGTWTKVNEEESTELNSMNMTLSQKDTYFNLKNEISTINNSETENKKSKIATAVMDTNLTDEQKAYVYGKNYSSDETLSMVVNGGIDFNEYLKYAAQTITADKDSNGKSISGSKKAKVISAINSLSLSIPQKAMLIRREYSSFRDYNNDIVQYVSGLDISYSEKVEILKELDMTVSADGTVSWK